MKKSYIRYIGLALVLFLSTKEVFAQQGFGTNEPHKSAAIDIKSSKRGLLIPRVKLVDSRNGEAPIYKPAQSLMVYNESAQNDVYPGYYYWEANQWVRFANQSDMTTSIKNKIEKKKLEIEGKESIDSNTLVSTVNNDASEVKIIESVVNKVDGANLTTSINGVGSQSIDLTPMIQDIQNKVIVREGNGVSVHKTDKENNEVFYDVAIDTKDAKNGQILMVKGDGEDKKVKWESPSTNGIIPMFFYMPSVIFDTSKKGSRLERNLYRDYYNQFTGGKTGVGSDSYSIGHGAEGSVITYTGGLIGSKGAPSDIPVVGRNDLHYYITYYDTDVFSDIKIDENGFMTYNIINESKQGSFMTIVFVLKNPQNQK